MRMYNLTFLADQSLQTVILCSHFLTVLTASPVKARQQVYQLDLGLWRSLTGRRRAGVPRQGCSYGKAGGYQTGRGLRKTQASAHF